MTSIAEAPSEIADDEPAVTVPPFGSNAGGSAASAATVVSGRATPPIVVSVAGAQDGRRSPRGSRPDPYPGPASPGTRSGRGRFDGPGFHAGYAAARGRIVATIDADLQNDPRDLALLLAALDGADAAVGWRLPYVVALVLDTPEFAAR